MSLPAHRRVRRRLSILATVLSVGGLIASTPADAVTAGSQLWSRRYDGPAGGDDSAADVAVSADGTRVYVTGGSDGGTTGKDYATRAYDASTGSKLWTARYDGAAHFDDDALSIAVSPDDSMVFVSGESSATTEANNYDYATIAYDAVTGAELWAKRYDGPDHSNDAASSLAVSPDGLSVFVTGTSLSFTTSFDFVTIAYAAETGVKAWQHRYNGGTSGIDEPAALAVAPNGSIVFVTGLSGSTHNFDMETVAYATASGVRLWKRRLDGPAQDLDYANALVVSPDGNHVIVTGTTTGLGTLRDYTTIAYDAATGADAWTTRWAGPYYGDDVANTIDISPDGDSVYVAGFGPTIAYDASTGAEQWNKVYRGLGNASGIAVGPDGSFVIATGDYWKTNLPGDLGTISFDASSGAKLWARHEDAPASGEDSGRAISIGPDGGSVYVTGRSDGGASGLDYLTVSYAT